MAPNIPDLAEKAITNIEYGRLGAVTTLCVIQMDNGHEVVGQSHCANPASFDEEIGRVEALKIAMGKVEELIAFRLKEESPTNAPEEIPPGEWPLYRDNSGKLVRVARIVDLMKSHMKPGVDVRLTGGFEAEISERHASVLPPQEWIGMYLLYREDGEYQPLCHIDGFTPVNEEELRKSMGGDE
jgi:hypothetical protein